MEEDDLRAVLLAVEAATTGRECSRDEWNLGAIDGEGAALTLFARMPRCPLLLAGRLVWD